VSPQATVDITLDGTLAGTGMCDQNNDFTVPVTIHTGKHTLVASTTTMSDQHGPNSSALTVSGSSTVAASPITILADNPVMFLGSDEMTTWTGTVTAAASSQLYVHVDWGDGDQYNGTITPGAQNFTHQYHGQYSHNLLVSVSDAAGHTTAMQYASAAFTLPAARQPVQAASIYDSRTVTGLYGLYVTVVCIAALIWLEAKHAARATRTS
jgi:outer membrane usher protein FimD/PapC